MNATSGKVTLLATIAALVIAGAFGAARADDTAGMKSAPSWAGSPPTSICGRRRAG